MASNRSLQQSVDIARRQALMELCRHLETEGFIAKKASPARALALRAGISISIASWSTIPEAASWRRDLLERFERHSYADFFDVEILRDRRIVTRESFARQLPHIQRGLRAVEIVHGYESELVPPSRALLENRGFDRNLELFCQKRGLSYDIFWRSGAVWAYEATVWRARWLPEVSVRQLYRGDAIVQPAEVDAKLIEVMAKDLVGWLITNMAADGAIPYKYWPSRAEEAPSDNALRRFMATVWLNRWALRSGADDARDAADRNLRRNLDAYFVERDGRGFIEHDGKAKLGASAFAAMALRETPRRDEFSHVLAKIDAGIDSLWQQDGSFRTFAWPKFRNDNQNFYPGEALLYWAQRHRETGEPALLERAMKSVAWYREYHLANRNPAFVPWHSQAASVLYDSTGESWLRDYVFDMNDWLLAVQQVDVETPDVHGRFYDPKNQEFGPPHASSTGVYLEGLADAFRVAHAAGDSTRAGRYAQAIWMGLRNLRQLQYRGVDDLALYGRKSALAGALRTEVYDNTIRIDNVQHALGAVMKVLDQPAFLATEAERPTAPLTAGKPGDGR